MLSRWDGRPFRQNVLQGNGFALERADPIDVVRVADAPQTPTTSTS